MKIFFVSIADSWMVAFEYSVIDFVWIIHGDFGTVRMITVVKFKNSFKELYISIKNVSL